MNSAEVETTCPPISFDTHHDDVIHDAKVDFYGRRLATASSDRTIRIFQINENETETLLSILSGHEGPVWQVAWAHPKFGSILASCSYDGSVIIWQEDKQSKSQNPNGTHSTWTKIKVHRVHEASVNSICFAPHAYGLHLACASSDGKISILSQVGEEWKHQILNAHASGCNSVSWAPSAVASSLLALDFNALEKAPIPVGPKIIASGGCDNTVKLWKAVEEEGEGGVLQEKWKLEETLSDHTDWVRDVCWRPNMGQVGHMLVSCSQDNTVLIWKVNKESKKWESKRLKPKPFPDTLWRVSFSEYGHLLAVSCGDNTVTIWRENLEDGTWELAGNVNENVTETVKIEEPLAVAPPPSAPVPEINFNSTNNNKLATDAGYMKPMSPIIPAPPSSATNQYSTGYQQVDQAYEEYQHALTPTIPTTFEPPSLSNGLLSSSVVPENTYDQYQQGNYYSNNAYNENVYNYEQTQEQQPLQENYEYPQTVEYEQPQEQQYDYTQPTSYENQQETQYVNNYEHQEARYPTDYCQNQESQFVEDYNQNQESQYAEDYNQNQESQYGQYEEPTEEFNKDIGFVSAGAYDSAGNQYPTSSYEQNPGQEQSNYSQFSADQPSQIQQTSYEQSQYQGTVTEQPQVSYEASNFEETSYGYDQQPYDTQTAYNQADYYASEGQVNYYQSDVQQTEYYQTETNENQENTLQYEGYQTATSAYGNADSTHF